MKETNLNVFYHLGSAMQDLRELHVDMPLGELLLKVVAPAQWLTAFILETESIPMPESRKVAKALGKIFIAFLKPPFSADRRLTQLELLDISSLRDRFEKELEVEHRNINVFTVLPKGIYDTRKLIESPEQKFPESVLKFIPENALYDFRQAGRCLAFEVPTACAFHVCRGTEAVMLAYHKHLTKASWKYPKRDWKIYVEQLTVAGAPSTITTRLDEIRVMERNPYTHPEKTVTLDEAPTIFQFCDGVIFFMAQEMSKTI